MTNETAIDPDTIPDIDGEGGVYLYLRDEKFECRNVSINWEFMLMAKAQRTGNVNLPHGNDVDDKHIEDCTKCKAARETRNAAGMDALAAMYNMVMKLLKPSERDRFSAFMDENALNHGELDEAIGDVTSAFANNSGKESDTTDTSSNAPASLNNKLPANS